MCFMIVCFIGICMHDDHVAQCLHNKVENLRLNSRSLPNESVICESPCPQGIKYYAKIREFHTHTYIYISEDNGTEQSPQPT